MEEEHPWCEEQDGDSSNDLSLDTTTASEDQG
jgi:hypothetical protein